MPPFWDCRNASVNSGSLFITMLSPSESEIRHKCHQVQRYHSYHVLVHDAPDGRWPLKRIEPISAMDRPGEGLWSQKLFLHFLVAVLPYQEAGSYSTTLIADMGKNMDKYGSRKKWVCGCPNKPQPRKCMKGKYDGSHQLSQTNARLFQGFKGHLYFDFSRSHF